MNEFTEILEPNGWTQRFLVDEVLYRNRTAHQDLVIFRNSEFGRVMALDGVVQTTEGDEFVYHEMLAHVPVVAHGRARRVLIIGGGDGGMLRETLRHRSVEHVTQVEIDAEVIETCRRYLPNHSAGAFDDPRAQIVIEDGLRFVSESADEFDVIISDSTDPVGPGEALYSSDFYAACRKRLRPGGVLVAQNGNIFTQLDEVRTTAARLAPLFADAAFYTAAIPTYIGGAMAFAWATDDPALRRVPLETLQDRWDAAGIETRYYTPAIHQAAFALPRFVLDAVEAARAGASL
ncbi:MAG TPA: polyamine aminopropyltransferase [Arenicellales bacterium]|nr:polyamine aminopropyltransferase [Arenicellales bacterium]